MIKSLVEGKPEHAAALLRLQLGHKQAPPFISVGELVLKAI